MSCRKLVESAETCVDDMLAGLATSFPQLQLLPEARALVIPSKSNNTVAVVSGGGAGHEPFSVGYVGEGMLTGAVSGSVFASPPSPHIFHTVRHLSQTHKGGIVLIVPNYTGDVLNFGLAAEWARKDGIKLETVVVNEDCALRERGSSQAGSRGMCGHLFVYKITGQLATEGKSVEEVARAGRRVVESMATMGLCTSACSLPGTGSPLFTIKEGLVELGLGVHGEAGTRTLPFSKVSILVDEVVSPVISTLRLHAGNRVAVVINNLGSTTNLEQWIIAGAVRKNLVDKEIVVERLYAGPIMTSLDMAGFQVCILRLDDSDWLRCLDAKTEVAAWPGSFYSIPSNLSPPARSKMTGADPTEFEDAGPELSAKSSDLLKQALVAALQALNEEKDYLNVLDSGCGDGDCGSTMARFASGVLKLLPSLRFKRPATLLSQLAALASTQMGGTSGAVYGLFLSGAAAALSKAKCKPGEDISDQVAEAWKNGTKTITTYSTARRGDRTLLDALLPACDEFEKALQKGSSPIEALSLAVEAAREGCAETRTMKAEAGRASYVHSDRLTNVDAGAFGVSVWISELCSVLSKS